MIRRVWLTPALLKENINFNDYPLLCFLSSCLHSLMACLSLFLWFFILLSAWSMVVLPILVTRCWYPRDTSKLTHCLNKCYRESKIRLYYQALPFFPDLSIPSLPMIAAPCSKQRFSMPHRSSPPLRIINNPPILSHHPYIQLEPPF